MKRYIISLVVSMFLFSLHADVSIVVDLSKGVTNSEFKELINLSFPKKHQEETIYKNAERVHLYAFKGVHSIKKDFIYFGSRVDGKKNKAARKKYMEFFTKVKKYKKAPKKERINANVVFVVDTSGSMQNRHHDYLASVKEAMKELVRNKSKKAKISIVTFDGTKKMKASQRSRIIAQNLQSKSKLMQKIDSIKVSKYDTFLGSGLQKAQSLLPQRSKRKSVIMIFTDGAEINDYDDAIAKVHTLKKKGIEIKVVAVGGADVTMLKQFSTSGYVFNATRADLQSIIKNISMNTDEIILRLDDFLSMYSSKDGDTFLLYSSMENIDSISDFTLIPNITSKTFYKEFEEQNRERGIDIDFKNANLYARVLGEKSPEETKRLKTFWSRYFRDHNANLRYFSTSELEKSGLK